MLEPKKSKYRKKFRRRSDHKGVATRGNRITFGSYGLKALAAGEITSRQLEATRQNMTRTIKRGGQIWIRIFPDKPITRKGAEVPMGSGKGALDHYVAVIRPGRILFEMEGVSPELAKKALTNAAHKLPIKCRFIDKNNF